MEGTAFCTVIESSTVSLFSIAEILTKRTQEWRNVHAIHQVRQELFCGRERSGCIVVKSKIPACNRHNAKCVLDDGQQIAGLSHVGAEVRSRLVDMRLCILEDGFQEIESNRILFVCPYLGAVIPSVA